MSIQDFEEMLKTSKVQLTEPLDETMTVGEIGLDSFDLMVISFDLESKAGQELKLSLNDTVGDILRKVNA